MSGSTVHDAAIEHVQQGEHPIKLQVRILESRLETIEHLVPLTRTEKLRLRLANALKVKAAAYGLSALLAVAAGQAVQNVEREVTEYSSVKREQLLQKMAQKIEARNAWSQTDSRQQDIGAWLHARYRAVTLSDQQSAGAHRE